MTLAGKTVVVVGGSSGIGRAAAEHLAQDAGRVVIIGRSDDRAQAAVESAGPAASAITADAGDAENLAQAFQSIGRIDHLVIAAAGGAGAGTVRALDTRNLRAGFDEKFWVHWTTLKTALAYVAEDASITFVGAARSFMSDPGSVGLAAINGALDPMVPPLAVDLAPRRVNAVAPGVIDTPPWQALPDEQRQAVFRDIAARTPLGRVGKAEEVAAAIESLIRNDFVTGVILRVDGGLSL